MQWINPAGAWCLSALAGILALYFLKRRYVETKVPSSLLWLRALQDYAANRPFERLRRNLLLMLQLLVALVLALAVMRPAIVGGAVQPIVMIFDLSASMGADEGGASRLERSKAYALKRLDGITGDVTILTAGDATRQPLTRATDKAQAARVIAQLAPEEGGANLKQALSLAHALSGQVEGLATVVYTDGALPAGTDEQRVSPYAGADNRAVLSLGIARPDGQLQVLARVANYGEDGIVTVSMSADGALCGAQGLALAKGQTGSVTFELPEDAQVIRAEILERDALDGDNAYEADVPKPQPLSVGMAGTGNIFLEKALAVRADLTVSRGSVEEIAQTGFDLYIFDGALPAKLPEQGKFMLFAPGEGDTAARLTAAGNHTADLLTEHMPLEGLAVRAFSPVTQGTPVLLANGVPVLTVEDGVVRFGFDLHDSNLPVKMDFPVLMRGLLHHLMPEAEIEAGARMGIDRAESDVRTVPEAGQAASPGEAAPAAGREITMWLMGLALMLLLVEWWVNGRVA